MLPFLPILFPIKYTIVYLKYFIKMDVKIRTEILLKKEIIILQPYLIYYCNRRVILKFVLVFVFSFDKIFNYIFTRL